MRYVMGKERSETGIKIVKFFFGKIAFILSWAGVVLIVLLILLSPIFVGSKQGRN